MEAFKSPSTSDPSEPCTRVARQGALHFRYSSPLTEQSCSIQINHQPDSTIFQFIVLTFVYSSSCFGRSPAHHPELNDCNSSLWFYSSYRGNSRTVFRGCASLVYSEQQAPRALAVWTYCITNLLYRLALIPVLQTAK